MVLFEPGATPGLASGVRSELAGFAHVFENDPEVVVPEAGPLLQCLIRDSRTEGLNEATLNLEFTYPEPAFVRSKEFALTERMIWRELRLLRAIFEDTYWAALKSNGISFEHFTFPGPWTAARQAYGLAVATADFRAVREALSYLVFCTSSGGLTSPYCSNLSHHNIRSSAPRSSKLASRIPNRNALKVRTRSNCPRRSPSPFACSKSPSNSGSDRTMSPPFTCTKRR